MPKLSSFTPNLSGVHTVDETLVVHIDEKGKPCDKDQAVKSKTGVVTLIRAYSKTKNTECGIADLTSAVSVFGSVAILLNFVVAKINGVIKATEKLSLIASLAGRDRIIANTEFDLRKAKIPESVIAGIVATMRATLPE